MSGGSAIPTTTMTRGRRKEYERNRELEFLLSEIATLLGPVEDAVAARFTMPRFPVIFVVGGPRGGSTVMMQWLAATGLCSYPTNLLSRFYRAPYIGAKIQLLLTDPRYDYKDELSDFARAPLFSSDLGKTRGVLEPNDFWYFWRRFVPNTEPVWLSDEDLLRVDGTGLASELAAIEAVFRKPFAMKGMLLQQNIPFLAGLLDRALFLHVRRHPFFNIQSLLESREKFFGDRRRWYSIKPREYGELEGLDPIEQVAGQVYYKNLAVDRGLQLLPERSRLEIAYEDFCREPRTFVDRLVEKLADHGYAGPVESRGPESFPCANHVRLEADDCRRIIESYRRFSDEDITP